MPKSKPKPINAPLSDARIPGGWRHFGKEEIARLHRLYYDPKVRVSKIAVAFGVSTSTLLRWIDEMDWPSRRQMKRDSIAALRDLGRDLRAAQPGDAEFGAAAQLPEAAAHEAAYAARVARGLGTLEREAAEASAPVAARDSNNRDAPEGAGDADETIDPKDFTALCEAVGSATLRELSRVKRRRGPDASAQNARALASLVRTLATLDELRGRRRDHQTATPNQRPARSMAELRAELSSKLAMIRKERDESAAVGLNRPSGR